MLPRKEEIEKTDASSVLRSDFMILASFSPLDLRCGSGRGEEPSGEMSSA